MIDLTSTFRSLKKDVTIW